MVAILWNGGRDPLEWVVAIAWNGGRDHLESVVAIAWITHGSGPFTRLDPDLHLLNLAVGFESGPGELEGGLLITESVFVLTLLSFEGGVFGGIDSSVAPASFVRVEVPEPSGLALSAALAWIAGRRSVRRLSGQAA